MTTAITIACILTGLILLGFLSVIDLKTRLLPNKYVAGFLTTGFLFHLITQFHFTSRLDMILGIISSAGLLLLVRQIANKMYERDTLGLGDVKLMGAAGIWLGLEHIFLAISLGAFAGILHGLIYRYISNKQASEKVSLSTLSIPAGPGFIVGIIVIAFIKFQTLPVFLGL